LQRIRGRLRATPIEPWESRDRKGLWVEMLPSQFQPGLVLAVDEDELLGIQRRLYCMLRTGTNRQLPARASRVWAR
jgi:hypothetical protein